MRQYAQPLSLTLATASCLALASCGKQGPKPSDADVSAYLASSQPPYLKVTGVATSDESIDSLGSSKLPAGSWRVHVQFTLRAQQDLFAPAADARDQRQAFDRAVAALEEFRVGRIAAVEQLGRQLGLVAPGATSPEPAVRFALSTRKGQDLTDQVDLLAQPDGKSWKFLQLNAQSLTDEAIGAPLAELKQTSPKTVFVLAGSDEDKAYKVRETRFLDIVSHAPKP